MVAEAVNCAMKKVRGGAEPPAPGSVPSVPLAMQCGNFLKAEKLPFPSKNLLNEKIPSNVLPVTQEDLLLLNEADKGVARSVSIKEKVFLDFEENSRRGLMAVSAMDSFLGGLVKSLRDEESEGFTLKEDIDSADLVSFIKSLAENLKFTASSLASLHVNFALCRRDSLLSQSQALSKSNATKASLRSLPLLSSALFGGEHLAPTIHGLAESKRDMAFAMPRPPSRPVLKGKPTEARRGRGAKAPSSRYSDRLARHKFSSFDKDKRRSGKPYERPQASRSPAKPSPQ